MSEKTGLAPFASTHSDDFPAILTDLGISLVTTTYQSGKLAFISPTANGITQLLRTFDNPMGCAVAGARLAVACRNEVLLLSDNPAAAKTYPRKPNTYDAFYLPRASYFTGPLDIHDMVWTGSTELLMVNTRFSCLARPGGGQYSFESVWQPGFISALAPEDRCHLNGLAMDGSEVRYVTALGESDQPQGWRERKADGGVLLDVASGEIVLPNLAMPHSPRLIDGELYVLNSAAAELLRVDPQSGKSEVVTRLPGFARGMCSAGDYVFIGLSEVRQRNQTFGDLALAGKAGLFCGLVAVHLPTGAQAAHFRYLRSAKEIYDVQVIPGKHRPGIMGVQDERHHEQITSTDGVWWAQTNS